MNILSLGLYNYRNFSQVEEIGLPTNSLLVAVAPNATGKTNFLEALVMLLRGKSWRASNQECVGWGGDSFIVKGEVERGGNVSTLGVRYHLPTRKLRIERDGVPISPMTFYSQYPLVLFLSEDVFLFTRGPAVRRNFMNRALVGDHQYIFALIQYQRVLKQRNTAIKKVNSFSEIESWTELLIEHGIMLWRARKNMIAYIGIQLSDLYERLSNEKLDFSVELITSVEESDNFRAALEKSFEHERHYGYTIYGPHRDDIIITVSGRPAHVTLSQGQLRTVALALKIATFFYLESKTGEKPILLLDEALSELDENRQILLLKNLPEAQILLTCATVPKSVLNSRDIQLLDLRSILIDKKGVEENEKIINQKQEDLVAVG